MSLPPSLRPLADAATQLAHGNEHAALALTDAFTTSRAGFTALLFGRYRITPDGTEWDTERLAQEIDDASKADADTARRIARRASDVGRVLSYAEGPERRHVLSRLVSEQPITAGADPYRPVNVQVTAMPQRQIDLGKGFDRVQLRVAEAGSSTATPLLLLHGHASRIEEYEALATLLAKDFRVVVLDMLGSGYSDKPAFDYSIDHLQPVLERAMEVLGLTSEVRVAGGGLGGNLALRLAFRDRMASGYHRMAKVAAWSVAGWGDTKPLLAAGARALRHAPEGIFFTVAKKQLSEQFAGASDADAQIRAGMAYRREVQSRSFQDAYFSIAADQVGTTMISVAGELKLPVQLLIGERDTPSLGLRAASEKLAGLMKVDLHTIQGAGYAIASEQPASLALAITDFLR